MNGVYEDMSFLEAFLRNLLMGEKNELKNRYMHIKWDETSHYNEKQHIEQHIEEGNSLLKILDKKEISSKTKGNILKLHVGIHAVENLHVGKGFLRCLVSQIGLAVRTDKMPDRNLGILVLCHKPAGAALFHGLVRGALGDNRRQQFRCRALLRCRLRCLDRHGRRC